MTLLQFTVSIDPLKTHGLKRLCSICGTPLASVRPSTGPLVSLHFCLCCLRKCSRNIEQTPEEETL